MDCLFCGAGKSFTTKEHIIPESLGNDDMILIGEVCDKCQNYLSQIENYVLNKTPIGFWRTLFTIKTKKNKLPVSDFSKPNNKKGLLPDNSVHNDVVQFRSHSDYTTELILPKPLNQYVNADSKAQIKYVMTPKVVSEIGRFLGKVGIEIVCLNDRENARQDEFKKIRQYVRDGVKKELWPIFHTNEGDIKSLFEYVQNGTVVEEKVVCYTYHLLQIYSYIVFNLKVGTDSWFICLNQQFPHPDVSKLMGDNVNTLWYSGKQWKA